MLVSALTVILPGSKRCGMQTIPFPNLEDRGERGSDREVARAPSHLSDTNRLMCLYEEGIRKAKGALEILERLGNTPAQAGCLIELAWSVHDDKQFDAAEEAASHAIDLMKHYLEWAVCDEFYVWEQVEDGDRV